MRLIRLLPLMALIGLVPAGGSADAAPYAIAGHCELMTLEATPTLFGTRVDGSSNTCAVSGLGGAQTARMVITSPSVDVTCSGLAARGVDGPVTVSLYRSNGLLIDSFSNVSLIVDSAPGSQTFNPTASALLKGISFAGAGTFTRSGSGHCLGPWADATWNLGEITFEDPTL